MRIVLCNCPVQEAESIAKSLVQDHLAACVNIIPLIKSIYFWQGKLCEEQEATLLIKIRKEDFALLEQKIKTIHPYTVPELVSINIAEANMAYVKWLYEATDRVARLDKGAVKK